VRISLLNKPATILISKLKKNDLKVLTHTEIRNNLNEPKLSDNECEAIANTLKKLSLLTAKMIHNAN
jgi:hypothetical protein